MLRDKAFVRVWALTAVLATISFGQSHQPRRICLGFGGIGPHGLAVAFAANTLTVVVAQLLILRRLAGHQPTTAAALVAPHLGHELGSGDRRRAPRQQRGRQTALAAASSWSNACGAVSAHMPAPTQRSLSARIRAGMAGAAGGLNQPWL